MPTLKALVRPGETTLDASIRHWWENVAAFEAGCEMHMFADSCALCKERNNPGTNSFHPNGTDCFGRWSGAPPCPIATATGHSGCEGTPWEYVTTSTSFRGDWVMLHPAVMAWWLEDVRMGKATLFIWIDAIDLIDDWGYDPRA